MSIDLFQNSKIVFNKDLTNILFENKKNIISYNMGISEYTDDSGRHVVFLFDKNNHNKAVLIQDIALYRFINNYMFLTLIEDYSLTLIVIDSIKLTIEKIYENFVVYENVNDKSVLISTNTVFELLDVNDLSIIQSINKCDQDTYENELDETFYKAKGTVLTLYNDNNSDCSMLINERSGKCIKSFNKVKACAANKQYIGDLWIRYEQENEDHMIIVVGPKVYSTEEYLDHFGIEITETIFKDEYYFDYENARPIQTGRKIVDHYKIKTKNNKIGTMSDDFCKIKLNNELIKSVFYGEPERYFQ